MTTKKQIDAALARALVATALAIAITFIAGIIYARAEPQIDFYNSSGSYAGTQFNYGRSSTFTDKNGKFDGTAIRNSDGTTSFYDRNGHFSGQSFNRGKR
jgi:hypothetical protein